jgi:hypothetical protein
MEKFVIGLWAVVDPLLIGGADKYRGTAGQDIARAMRISAERRSEKLKVFEWREMRELLSHG